MVGSGRLAQTTETLKRPQELSHPGPAVVAVTFKVFIDGFTKSVGSQVNKTFIRQRDYRIGTGHVQHCACCGQHSWQARPPSVAVTHLLDALVLDGMHGFRPSLTGNID